MTCDVTTPVSSSKAQDAWLAQYEAQWHSIARYSIVRSHFGHPKRVVARGQTYAEAKKDCPDLDAKACQEVGCRPDAFGRPIHNLELENAAQTRERFRALRAKDGR